MNPEFTTSRLANLAANQVFDAFAAYRDQFNQITARASSRFAMQDWQGVNADTAQRIELYLSFIRPLVESLRKLFGERQQDEILWSGIKAVYSGLIANRDDWDLAETFYNSLVRRFYSDVAVNPLIEFVDSDFVSPPTNAKKPVYKSFHGVQSITGLIRQILESYDLQAPFAQLEMDAGLVAEHIEEHLRAISALTIIERADMVTGVFYRNKAAYLVGRASSGSHQFPLIFSLTNTPQGIKVDAVLLNENDASILFSFTRSYFHVEIDSYYELVRFLNSIMPLKRSAELYISLGHNKHGKTLLYRELFQHLNSSVDLFEIAPGQKGMVMVVFTIPGFDMVFKLIKDRFTPPKKGNRATVQEKYTLVFKHDRAGRLVDAQEFQYLRLDRNRFSDELIAELKKETRQSVELHENDVIVKHCYIERRMIPLDLYLQLAEPSAAREAVIDYGRAIKDLALSNVFPGDMLLKNFGVTRHGRVVFYDYDELCLLTTCNFRNQPPPQSLDEELSAEPWYGVGENDIFPGEFRHFLGLGSDMLQVFQEHHEDLFDVEFWKRMQSHILNQDVTYIYPYTDKQRLHKQ